MRRVVREGRGCRRGHARLRRREGCRRGGARDAMAEMGGGGEGVVLFWVVIWFWGISADGRDPKCTLQKMWFRVHAGIRTRRYTTLHLKLENSLKKWVLLAGIS